MKSSEASTQKNSRRSISQEGSTMIEAAIVFPIIIFVVCLVLMKSVNNSEFVRGESKEHEESAIEYIESRETDCEQIIRERWILQ